MLQYQRDEKFIVKAELVNFDKKIQNSTERLDILGIWALLGSI